MVRSGGTDWRTVMTALNLPAIIPARRSWNKGRIIGQKRPLLPQHVWAIRVRLKLTDNARDLALHNTAMDSELRGCALVHLKVSDVYIAGRINELTSTLQSKTKQSVQFEITDGTRNSLAIWIDEPAMAGSEYLWPGWLHAPVHILTRQYARLVKAWVASVELEPSAYGTHSLRRTKAAQIYKITGNLRTVQLLLGHTKIDTTVRYLGVELEDALEISESVEF